jgi:hypothetical protein
MPLMGTFPDPACPAVRANEAAGVAKASSAAMASFAESLDMAKLHICFAEAVVGLAVRRHH